MFDEYVAVIMLQSTDNGVPGITTAANNSN